MRECTLDKRAWRQKSSMIRKRQSKRRGEKDLERIMVG